jgi:hypothetical protein
MVVEPYGPELGSSRGGADRRQSVDQADAIQGFRCKRGVPLPSLSWLISNHAGDVASQPVRDIKPGTIGTGMIVWDAGLCTAKLLEQVPCITCTHSWRCVKTIFFFFMSV